MSSQPLTDSRGLPVTADSNDAIARFDAVLDDTYYYRLGTQDRLDALIEEHPDFTLAQILKGYSLMSEGTSDMHPRAQAYLKQAEALSANSRERMHMEALRAWISQDLSARTLAWEQILVQWPLDLLAFRQLTGNLFWTGNKRHQAEVCGAIACHWGPQTPGYAHFLSTHAFSMEEVGLYEVAERSGRAALELNPHDLWALHSLAHVFEMQGRTEEGIELLTDSAQFLNDYNLFRGHLWWHLALFKLTQGGYDEALELFDREIYPKSSTFYLDVQNGVSLLARLECQGIDVGQARWQRLAEASEQTAAMNTLWFTSMHQIMALQRCGKDQALISTLDYLARSSTNSSQSSLALDLGNAAIAYCQKDLEGALATMLNLRQRQGELGASHAQQDLYYQLMVTAALQLSDLPRVRQLLKARLETRVWDAASWQTCADRTSKVDSVNDEASVRAALRWALWPEKLR